MKFSEAFHTLATLLNSRATVIYRPRALPTHTVPDGSEYYRSLWSPSYIHRDHSSLRPLSRTNKQTSLDKLTSILCTAADKPHGKTARVKTCLLRHPPARPYYCAGEKHSWEGNLKQILEKKIYMKQYFLQYWKFFLANSSWVSSQWCIPTLTFVLLFFGKNDF